MSEGSGHRTGISRRIWLFICENGGTWTPDAIAMQFGIERQAANVTMQNMVARGASLQRFRSHSGRACFGITKDCQVPAGVTVADLKRIGALEVVSLTDDAPSSRLAQAWAREGASA